MFKPSLFRKFAAVLIGISLLPVAFLGVQLIGISHRGIQAAVLELHTKLAEGLADEIGEYLKVKTEEINFSLVSLHGAIPWPEKEKLLQGLIDGSPDLIEVSLVGRKGVDLLKAYNPNLISAPKLLSHLQEEGFKKAIAGKEQMNFSKVSGIPVAVLYAPLAPTVIARVEISLSALAQKISSERVGGTGFAVLVDGKGAPLVYPKGYLNQTQIAGFSSWPIVRAAIQAISVGSSEFKAEGHSYVGAYAPVSSLGGAILIFQKFSEAYSAELRMRKTALGAIFFVAFLAILAAAIFARRLTRPLLSLTGAARAVSAGDFSVHVRMDTQDELRDLADTFNQMTQRLKAYAELQVDRLVSEQKKTEAILYSIDEGIMLVDQEGRLGLLNRRAIEILGLPNKDTGIGRPLAQILNDGPLKVALLEAKLPAEGKENIREVDVSSDIGKLVFQIISRQVLRPAGQEPGLLVAIRDITLQRELDQMKEDFLHYVTHDLRNPLGSIMGFSEILLGGIPGPLTEDQRSILSSIQRSSRRLMSLINNILDIAKMESGKVALNLRKISLKETAERSADILGSLAQAKKIAIHVKASDECAVVADGDLLERVFTNLLGNAIKYTPQNGTITLSVEDQGDFFKACVADTGEGIPKDYLERVFIKFEQVEGKARGGTGLGLTISRFFVESHLGKIWVESDFGHGSQFYFTIPKNLALDVAGEAEVAKK